VCNFGVTGDARYTSTPPIITEMHANSTQYFKKPTGVILVIPISRAK